MVRVVVADDDLLVRRGVAALLATEPDIEVVAQCADAASVITVLRDARADVVVTDIRMPPTHTDEGIRLAHDLRSRTPEVGVVVLSQHLEPQLALRLLDDGDDRRGYLLKERIGEPAQLIGAIRVVADGGSWVDPAVVDALLQARRGRRPGRLAVLSPRELEVLGEVARGRSNAAIADTLFVSERSVEKHVASILMKLDIVDDGGTNRRVSAALAYLSNGEQP